MVRSDRPKTGISELLAAAEAAPGDLAVIRVVIDGLLEADRPGTARRLLNRTSFLCRDAAQMRNSDRLSSECGSPGPARSAGRTGDHAKRAGCRNRHGWRSRGPPVHPSNAGHAGPEGCTRAPRRGVAPAPPLPSTPLAEGRPLERTDRKQEVAARMLGPLTPRAQDAHPAGSLCLLACGSINVQSPMRVPWLSLTVISSRHARSASSRLRP